MVSYNVYSVALSTLESCPSKGSASTVPLTKLFQESAFTLIHSCQCIMSTKHCVPSSGTGKKSAVLCEGFLVSAELCYLARNFCCVLWNNCSTLMDTCMYLGEFPLFYPIINCSPLPSHIFTHSPLKTWLQNRENILLFTIARELHMILLHLQGCSSQDSTEDDWTANPSDTSSVLFMEQRQSVEW